MADDKIKEKARALMEATNRAYIAENQHAKVKTWKLSYSLSIYQTFNVSYLMVNLFQTVKWYSCKLS